VKKRRQPQPENPADWSKANRTISTRASIIRVWAKARGRQIDRLGNEPVIASVDRKPLNQ
jgi:hypothetical protein